MHTFNPSILEEADLVYKGRSKIASLLQEKPFLKTKNGPNKQLIREFWRAHSPQNNAPCGTLYHSYKVMLYMRTMGQEPGTAIMEPWKPQSDRAMLLWKRRLSSHKHSY